jgi:hypothetical protein
MKQTVPSNNALALILAEHKKPEFKGTVSPDIAFCFRVYRFKTVLSVRLLKVLNLFIS